MKDFNWKPKHNDLKYILKTALNWEKRFNFFLKRACSSVVERYVDIVEVISSILSCPPKMDKFQQ